MSRSIPPQWCSGSGVQNLSSGCQAQPLDEVLPERGVGGVRVDAAARARRRPGGVEQDHRVVRGDVHRGRVGRVPGQLGGRHGSPAGEPEELRGRHHHGGVRVVAQPRHLVGRAAVVDRRGHRAEHRRRHRAHHGVQPAGQHEQHAVAPAHPAGVQPGRPRPGRLPDRGPGRPLGGEDDLARRRPLHRVVEQVGQGAQHPHAGTSCPGIVTVPPRASTSVIGSKCSANQVITPPRTWNLAM